jgi:hypothetical protein
LMSFRRWPEYTIANARGGSSRHSALKNDGENTAVMTLPREAQLLPCRRSNFQQPKS